MTIDDTDLAKARAAWDACLQQEREAQQLQARLVAIRNKLQPAFKRIESVWSELRADDELREVLDDQMAWLTDNVHGAGPVEPALKTLRHLATLTEFTAGRTSRGHHSDVSLDAIRAVARTLGLRSYGSSQQAKPLPDERQLLAVCKTLDERVTAANVRNALKTP